MTVEIIRVIAYVHARTYARTFLKTTVIPSFCHPSDWMLQAIERRSDIISSALRRTTT